MRSLSKIFLSALLAAASIGSAQADSHAIKFPGWAPQAGKSRVTSGNDNQLPAGCWVDREILSGGKQEGVELLTIFNGRLIITVIPTRGMSVLRVEDTQNPGFRLGWDSPVKQVVHPQFMHLESRGGLGWLEGFNEWMCRCGLEYAGHPGLDEFTTNTGDTSKMSLTLHGKIGNIPAHHVGVSVEKDGGKTKLAITGDVSEHMFFGPKLSLSTKLWTEPNADWFAIEDKVQNVGASEQEFQLIYHANYGVPLLGEGAKVLVPFKSVTPMNAGAAKAVQTYSTYKGPTPGFNEEVFLVEPLSENGSTLAVLKDAAGEKATSIRWQTSELPHLTIWKNTAATADGYVTGIEPATGYPFNRKIERKFGRVPKLKPNESRTFSLKFQVHSGKDNVKALEQEVVRLQGSTRGLINSDPPKTE